MLSRGRLHVESPLQLRREVSVAVPDYNFQYGVVHVVGEPEHLAQRLV